MKVSDQLQLILNLTGDTQEKLARKIGVSFATVNSWINDRSVPRKKAAQRIEALLKELARIREIPLDPSEAKKKIIEQKRKKHPRILNKILKRPDLFKQFILSLTYNSNRIEGSTFSEHETALVLFENTTITSKNMIEHLEVKNHQSALQYLFRYLQEDKRLDELLVLKLHAILMNGIQEDAGFYRDHPVRFVGSNIPTANYLKVPDRMKVLCSELEKEPQDLIGQDIIGLIAQIHSHFEQIHPFSDGNGRVGRLLMNAMLLQKNIAPAMIRQEKKKNYIKFLQNAQKKKDFSGLEEFLCEAILISYVIMEKE